MARFVVNDNLSAGLGEIGRLTDDEKWKILSAGAEVIKNAHVEQIKNTFKEHTGDLAKSPTVVKKFVDGELIARIQPKGKHKGTGTGIRKRKSRATPGIKYGKHNREGRIGKYEATNAEVAYYLNYGTPRIPATHWMEYANEKAEAAVEKKMADSWDEYLKSKGL